MADKLCEKVNGTYDLNLSKKWMAWGAVSPDILPQYKIVRHYKKYSEDFLVNEIVSLIYLFKFLNFKKIDRFKRKIFSTKIGVISHFLCDYMCLPHKENWTFDNAFKDHYKYERDLNRFVKSHNFTENVINVQPINLYEFETIHLKKLVIDYINKVEEEYSKAVSFKQDLDFALNLSLNISCFILDVVEALATQEDLRYSFLF
ncbi:zinc dependent phospholipase C family protein [Lagierella sp.]|uniref:zinc dependent phospholipase C family protein n=1 Tax=Lagierella sp. TaxID=2849657 RepID=UPI00260F87DB|nr:zinc dependent phospholipase C family protein [Lagierella sp.]